MKQKLNDFLDISLKIIAFVLPVIFILSILFNCGFFYFFKTSLKDLPLTLYDYIESPVYFWVKIFFPIALASVFFLVFSFIFTPKTKKQDYKENTRQIFWMVVVMLLLFVANLSLIAFNLYKSGTLTLENYLLVLLGSVDLEGYLIFYSFSFILIMLKSSRALIQKYIFVISLIVFVFILSPFHMGYLEAKEALNQKELKQLFLKNNNGAPLKVNILRNLDEGILVVMNKQIMFYYSDEIEKIIIAKI